MSGISSFSQNSKNERFDIWNVSLVSLQHWRMVFRKSNSRKIDFFLKLHRWLDRIFFIIILNLIFTSYIEIKIFSKTKVRIRLTEWSITIYNFRYLRSARKTQMGLTLTLSGSDIVYAVAIAIAQLFKIFYFFFLLDWFLLLVYTYRASKMKFFYAKEFFYMIFDFKNGCKNEFKDDNEKSCSWSRNRVSDKIDFKVQWLRNSHADSMGVNFRNKAC